MFFPLINGNDEKNSLFFNKLKNFHFANNRRITNICIPFFVKEIKINFFESSTLTHICIINSNLEKIDNFAFRNCKLLKSIILPENLKFLGLGVFSHCESLKKIIIPKRIKYLEQQTFNNCINLEEVVFLSSELERIDNFCFSKCVKIKKLNLPDSISLFGICVFNQCYSLQIINIPLKLKILNIQSFKGCFNMKKLVIPPNIEEIRYDCFKNCNSLKIVIKGECKLFNLRSNVKSVKIEI